MVRLRRTRGPRSTRVWTRLRRGQPSSERTVRMVFFHHQQSPSRMQYVLVKKKRVVMWLTNLSDSSSRSTALWRSSRRSCGLSTWRSRISTPRYRATLLTRQCRHTDTTRQYTRPTWCTSTSTRLRRSTARCISSRAKRRYFQLCRRSHQRGYQRGCAQGGEEEQKGQEPAAYFLCRDDESRGEDGGAAEVCGVYADLIGGVTLWNGAVYLDIFSWPNCRRMCLGMDFLEKKKEGAFKQV